MFKKPTFKQTPEAIVLGLVAGLLAIYLLALWRWEREVPELLYISTAIGLLSVLFKQVALWAAMIWMWLGQLMGKIVGAVLLTFVYLIFLTPLARLQALLSKSDKFQSDDKKITGTGWIERKHQFSSKDLEELW